MMDNRDIRDARRIIMFRHSSPDIVSDTCGWCNQRFFKKRVSLSKVCDRCKRIGGRRQGER